MEKFANISFPSKAVHALALLGALAISFLLPACAHENKQEEAPAQNTLTVAYVGDFFPYASKNAYEPQGFAIDLIESIANAQGKTCSFVKAQDEESAASLISQKKADVAIGSFDVSQEAPADCLYSSPYIDVDVALVALKNSGITSVDDLHTATIAVLKGSLACEWALRNLPNAQILEFDTMDEAFTALEAKNADAVACGAPNAMRRVKVAYADAGIIDIIDTDCAYVFACRNDETKDSINQGIENAESDGTYDSLFESWFGAATQRGEVEARTNEQGAPTFAKR